MTDAGALRRWQIKTTTHARATLEDEDNDFWKQDP
jgi:hypothetical protein